MNFLNKIYKSLTTVVPGWMFHVILISIWIVLHVPAIYYGTYNLPFHASYIGDEQSPITGALQILQSKNFFAIYNLESLYYGPLFAILALPAVVFDFVLSSVSSGIWSVTEYKNHILYDWGGIVANSRIIALLVGYLGIVALYKILTTKLINPDKNQLPVILGVLVLATNFYYFEYSSFFKHWVFILVPLLWQLYILLLMYEYPERIKKYFVLQALLAVAAFGVSYLSLLSQIILLPLFIRLVMSRDKNIGWGFFTYFATLIPLSAIVIAWHPAQVIRYLQIFSGNVLRTESNQYTLSVDSDPQPFLYFFKVIFFNHILIIFAGILLVIYFRKRVSKNIRPFLFSCLLLGVLYFIIVVAQSNHVSRYALPVILMLLMIITSLFTNLYSCLNQKMKIVFIGLLSISVIYHLVSIGFWSQMMIAGPVERVNISAIIEHQLASNEEKVLIVSSRLLGWPHTRESYNEFAINNDMEDRALFKAYKTSISPKIPLLSVSYVSNKKDVIELQTYAQIIECKDPEAGGELEDGDYSEVYLFRLWTTNYHWQYSCDTNF